MKKYFTYVLFFAFSFFLFISNTYAREIKVYFFHGDGCPHCAEEEKVLSKINVILITLGGETSYKCCKAIKSNELKLVDEVAPAISICSDINNRWIVTKSGNLGNTKTLIEILNYFKYHE